MFAIEFRCDAPCQQSTLHAVIMSIPTVYRDQPEHAAKLLLRILDTSTSQPPPLTSQDKISALLFEEDKSNSYSEPVQLLEYVTQAISMIPDVIAIDTISSIFLDCLSINGKDDDDGSHDEKGNLWKMKNGIVQNYFKKKYLKGVL